MTITGTRATTDVRDDALDEAFSTYLRPFADGSAAHFYLGGAAGIDTKALHWLAENTAAGLTVAVPCTLADQPKTATDVVRHWRQRGRLTDVIELREPVLATAAYHARNRWMVDRSGFVIGFPRGADPRSGTWYTLNYAASQGKPRLIVPL
ncbi:hypothetical protein AB0L13_46160 [Saccharopolyspora shandongensis]|uniref:hypothetical protein n=1 Tax=Saccharopolyspora shandongensis TaxID=418495 RepID=UPI003429B544